MRKDGLGRQVVLCQPLTQFEIRLDLFAAERVGRGTTSGKSRKAASTSIVLGLADAAAVGEAFRAVMARARSAAPSARIDGVLVAPMVSGGLETIVGTQHDPIFGPMVMFGLGGISVELFRDVAFASAPLSPRRAQKLIDAVRGAKLLDGWRGSPPLDRAVLAKVLSRVSEFIVMQQGTIDAVEINPLLVKPDGVVALDALIALC
jgi:acetate---CoA ligase (ADP-forming)